MSKFARCQLNSDTDNKENSCSLNIDENESQFKYPSFDEINESSVNNNLVIDPFAQFY